ncbi:MAG: DUF3570 domain-containing protein [Alphaproteobacteria bacterium]|nr:DUF3570 domain-containing protein [Alphaproteobacteria bacterium]
MKKPKGNRAGRRRARRRSREPARSPPANNALSALTASAMALPGLAGAAAADGGPVSQFSVDAGYSYYKEDNLPVKKSQANNPTRERMEIHSYQMRIDAPLDDRMDVSVDLGFETMSGASPWYVFQAAPGEDLVQVMSGATIDDTRFDALGTGNYYLDWGSASAAAGFSIEDDYYSGNLGLAVSRDFNDKNTTLSAGTGVSLDWLEPTQDRGDPGRPTHEDKQSINVYAGISQILTRHSAIQSTFSYDYSTGYLSDPYKRASVAGNLERDQRPSTRNQFTWLTRYRHHLSAFNGTLHLDYRFHADDWSINSSTFDIAWYQDLLWGIQIIPSFRYYSQSEADFYEPVYLAPKANEKYSSDYRLSPYGAISYRLKAEVTQEIAGGILIVGSLSYERYDSDADLALQNVSVENPGLVDFHLFAGRIGVTW